MTLTPEERRSVFGGFDPSEYEDEARRRWGRSDAHAQSARRTARLGVEDWAEVQAEAAAIYRRFGQLLDAGVEPGAGAAAAAVASHRRHISRFYDCTPEIHAGLGRMYVDDQRFASTIDAYGDGVAAYLAEAIAAAYAS